MNLIPGASQDLTPTAPLTGWDDGLRDLPDFTHPQLYSYLVSNKAITQDGEEMGAFRSIKALKFFKEGYVQQFKSNYSRSGLCYVTAKVRASMKNTQYNVEICMQRPSADIYNHSKHMFRERACSLDVTLST